MFSAFFLSTIKPSYTEINRQAMQCNKEYLLHDGIYTATVAFPHTAKPWLASNIPQLKTQNTT